MMMSEALAQEAKGRGCCVGGVALTFDDFARARI